MLFRSDTIRFTWINGTHPTRSETGTWSTFVLDAVTPTIDIAFTIAGSYPYYCEFHGGPGGIGMSGVINVSCAPPTCNTPSGLTATMVTGTSARISWIAVAGGTKYQIQYKPTAAVTWLKTNTTATFKKITGLTPATSYVYKVKTICAGGSSPYTAEQSFTTLGFDAGGGAGMKEEPMSEMHVTQMGLYPNPSSGNFKLVLEHVHQESVVMQVYDMTGKEIMEETVPVSGMGVVHNVQMPDGFKGNAVVKVNVGGTDYTKDILIQ